MICDSSVSGGSDNVFNIMSAGTKTTMSQVSILSILTTIIPDLSSHSSTICSKCFNLLDTIDTLQVQLRFKRSEVVTLYDNKKKNTENKTDKAFSTGDTVVVAEPPKKKEKGLLTSEDLKCQVCCKTFEKRRYLMDHLRRVHNSLVYQCKNCHLRFKLKEELNSHQDNCSKENHPETMVIATKSPAVDDENNKVLTKRKRNNQCKLCGGYFLTQALLKTHVKSVHEGEQILETDLDDTKIENPVVCSDCDITVNNEYTLAIHQGSVHGNERPWLCKVCGKNFARHLELINHKRVHSGDKPFQCDVCGARFNQKQNLHTHVRHLHLGERRYECSVCKMKFRRKRLLDCHTNSKHTLSRPYTCKHCDSTFVYPEHLKKHELSHGRATVFRCGQCSKSFKTKNSLTNHLSTHRPVTSYQCLSCPQYYSSKQQLLNHLKEAGHPRGVFSSGNSAQESKIIQVANTINTSIVPVVETVETVSVYDDVVLYLATDDVPVDTDHAQVFVEQHVVQDHQEVVHHRHQDEVQVAISSIVENKNQ